MSDIDGDVMAGGCILWLGCMACLAALGLVVLIFAAAWRLIA